MCVGRLRLLYFFVLGVSIFHENIRSTYNKMLGLRWLLLSAALPSAAALCATDAACRLLSLSLVTIFVMPLSLLHHALSSCTLFVRQTAQLAAIFTACVGAWALYAVLVPTRFDLAWIPTLYFASALVHTWMARAHDAGRPLLCFEARARLANAGPRQ
jgi:hypothetical protein